VQRRSSREMCSGSTLSRHQPSSLASIKFPPRLTHPAMAKEIVKRHAEHLLFHPSLVARSSQLGGVRGDGDPTQQRADRLRPEHARARLPP
jgi:hypothetical protein